MKWTQEPNSLEFTYEGIDCFILRHKTMLHLCGYCRVPENHYWRDYRYMDIPDNVSVHGGLTYSGKKPYGDESQGYWIGFDCAHAFDLSPGLQLIFHDVFSDYHSDDVYRDMEYVTEQCKSLAKQISKAMQVDNE